MRRKKDKINQNHDMIEQFQLLFLPIVIISKILRYTFLRKSLVYRSIGWRFLREMMAGPPQLAITGLSNMSNGASVAGINSEWMFHNFTLGIIENVYSDNMWGCYIAFEVVITLVFDIFIYLRTIDYFKNNNATQLEFIFICMNVAILNIFCLNVAKEPLQMVFFFLMAYAIKKGKDFRQKTMLTLSVILLSVFLVRKYYILVFLFMAMLYVFANFIGAENKKHKKKAIGGDKALSYILVLLIACGAIYFCMLSTLLKNNSEIYDELVFVNTRMGAADSQILPIFQTQNKFFLTADYLIKIFRLIFPVELLLHVKPTYLLAISYQGIIGYYLYKAVKNWRLLSDSTKVAYLLYFAFILCSASFEPDFGSWVRHQGVAYPVILLMLGTAEGEAEPSVPVSGKRKLSRAKLSRAKVA